MTETNFVSANLRRILAPWFITDDSTDPNAPKWPSNYPPNLNPRAETTNGKLTNRDNLPLEPFTEEHYVQFESRNARIKQVIFEDTRNGDRDAGGPNIIHATTRDTTETYLSFASCNCCFRLRARDFADTTRSPYPMGSQISCPDLAQIGLCGCIICNNCVRSVVNHPMNNEMDYVHCPYSGNGRSFSKYFCIWAVTEDVYEDINGGLGNIRFYL